MLCAKKIIHSCKELFGGGGGQNFVLEIVLFGRCNEVRDASFFQCERFVCGWLASICAIGVQLCGGHV